LVNTIYKLSVLDETTKPPRVRRRDANVERILAAAMEAIAEGGLEALSMNKLAASVDYTPGALYRYFDSKSALLSRLVERILDDVRAHLDRAVALLPAGASPLARVFALAHGYRAFARREPHRFGLIASTMAAPRVLLEDARDAQPVVASVLAAMQPLADALVAAAEARQLSAGSVADRTLALLAALQGALLLHKQARHAPGVLDVGRLVSFATSSLLVGWGASQRAVDAAAARVAKLGDMTRRLGGTA
jgi:AcrR family transcriptional regulator